MDWLVTITLPDGRAFRAASRPVNVTTRWSPADGPYQFADVLVGIDDFAEEVDYYSLDAVGTLSQARIELVTTVDLLALADAWAHLGAARGEVAIIEDGDDWEDRRVLLAEGRLQSIEIGLLGEATSFTLEALAPAAASAVAVRDAATEWPDPLTDTAGDSITSLAGAYIPRVYGAAALVPGLKVGDVGGQDRLVLACHDFADTGSVTVYEDGVSVGPFTPVNTSNSTGDYAYVQSATQFRASGGAYTYAPARGGLAKADDLAAAALDAADILHLLLVESGVKVDWRRQREALRLLAGWDVGFYVDDPTDALKLIRDRLLPVLPLVEIQGAEGLWYAYAEPWRRATELHLLVGQNILGRVGGMRLSDADAVRNAFTMLYDYDPFTREYRSEATLGPDSDALCYLSDQLHGEQAESLKTTMISSAEVAIRALRSMAGRLALQRRVLTYLAAPDLRDQLYAGQAVTLTDDDRSISAEAAVVSRLLHREAGPEIVVELIDRTPPARP